MREAQIFVAVLGCSNYTYVEATWTQKLEDWIMSHVRAFEFFGAVPEIVVCDNLRSAVKKAHRYDPEINRTYQDLAEHYGIAVVPARVRKPRDKAKAEQGVKVATSQILARLRKQQFFHLDVLNEHMGYLLDELNDKRFQKLDGSRRSWFETQDRPAMRPLPQQPYVYAEWKKARVHIDYHVEVHQHHYSVPYRYVKRQIDVRVTGSTMECFYEGDRIASHLRSWVRKGYTTLKAHMPPNHRHYANWTPERMLAWAARTGPATERVAAEIMARRAHPEQGYRTVLGILRLGEAHGSERLEAASKRAIALGTYAYRSIAHFLKAGLDKQPLPTVAVPPPTILHDNIRGADYYTSETTTTQSDQDTTC